MKPRRAQKKTILAAATALTAALLLIIPLSAAGQALTAVEIMTRADDRPDGEDRQMVMTMTLVNKRGRERVREVKSYSKDYGPDKKSVMVFLKPADVKDTAFLSWEYDDPERDDDKWLYMPAMKKVRRISGASTNDYFMGSDFTYDDMGDRNVEEDTHTLLEEEILDGHQCWKIESIPVDPDDMYTRKILWIHKEAFLALKVEYYDKDGLLKTYRVFEFRQQDGFWTIFRSEMENHSREHTTRMVFESVAYDTGIRDDLFQVSTIERGRIQ